MSRRFKIQPAARTDHIAEDGHELQQLPYPFFVDEAGRVGRQDFWNGRVFQVIGFVADPARMEVDIFWPDILDLPGAAVGLYLITADDHGRFSTHESAVAEVAEFEAEGEIQ